MKNNNYHDIDEIALNVGESIKIDNKIIKCIEITHTDRRSLGCNNCDLLHTKYCCKTICTLDERLSHNFNDNFKDHKYVVFKIINK